MNRPELSQLTNADLVRRFAEAAKKRGLAVLDNNVRNANRMFQCMDAVDSVLRARGLEARKAALPLLDSEDRFVRYFSAKRLLGIAPSQARAIIEWNYAHGFDAVAFDAGMTLSNLDSGVFKPD